MAFVKSRGAKYISKSNLLHASVAHITTMSSIPSELRAPMFTSNSSRDAAHILATIAPGPSTDGKKHTQLSEMPQKKFKVYHLLIFSKCGTNVVARWTKLKPGLQIKSPCMSFNRYCYFGEY